MITTLRDVTRAAKLISLPDVYLHLRTILDDPDFTMAEVAVVVSQDAAITVRLLRIVNSSLYGFRAKIETVSRAISLLGTQQVHDLVLATSVAQTFEGMATDVMDMDRFWRRSVYCAVVCRQLAALRSGCDEERVFVAGLLHDIGHLVMYQAIPELSQRAISAARETNQPLYKVERDLIGFNYAAINAELLKQWSLPESLRKIVVSHVTPGKAVKYPLETALVHIGSLLTKADDGEGEFNEGALAVESSAWAVSGFTQEECILLNEKIKERVGEVMNLIFSRESFA